ncbi:hypothetical protein HDV00_008144 [Rhizophlyctis rosea]|nr:hypothetical protein HDV00_008144 [Rhizophlyctis rosea]
MDVMIVEGGAAIVVGVTGVGIVGIMDRLQIDDWGYDSSKWYQMNAPHMASISSLPLEVAGEIPAYFPPSQLPILRSVCKTLRSATHFYILRCILRYIKLEISFNNRLKPDTAQRLHNEWFIPKLQYLCPISAYKKGRFIQSALSKLSDNRRPAVKQYLIKHGHDLTLPQIDHCLAAPPGEFHASQVPWTTRYPPSLEWWKEWVEQESPAHIVRWVLHPRHDGEHILFAWRDGVEPFFAGVKGLDVTLMLSVDPAKRWLPRGWQTQGLDRRSSLLHARMKICTDDQDDIGFSDVLELARGDGSSAYEPDVIGRRSDIPKMEEGAMSWLEWLDEMAEGDDVEHWSDDEDLEDSFATLDISDDSFSDTSSQSEGDADECTDEEQSDEADWLIPILERAPDRSKILQSTDQHISLSYDIRDNIDLLATNVPPTPNNTVKDVSITSVKVSAEFLIARVMSHLEQDRRHWAIWGICDYCKKKIDKGCSRTAHLRTHHVHFGR